jgi:twitching motility protein PilT
MAEMILGTGRHVSIRKIVDVLNAEIVKVEGHARTLVATSDSITIRAERPEFDGPFESYQVRFKAPNGKEDDLKAGIAAGEGYTLSTDDGFSVLDWTANGVEAGAVEDSTELIDTFGQLVTLPEVWRVKGERYRVDHVSVELLFRAMLQYKASDTHISPGDSPVFRIDGDTRHSEILPPLSATQIFAFIRELANDREWEEFERTHQTSFCFHELGMGYARVSAFIKAGVPHVTMRFLPEKIPSFDDLNIPSETMVQLAKLHRGLLLVTGMTGSGKSTTTAALVDWINANRTVHILTIENPVEYIHRNRKSVISQRCLGPDVPSFQLAIEGALRHDPDVIFIGEMRDPETIRAAINAAATGHLVISTLHSNSASEVVNRIISFFDPVERDLVKLQLRDSLKCVMCQRLLPKKGGGRLPALEIMINDIKPISDGIIEGDTDHIRIGMQQTVSHSFLFEEYLVRMYKKGLIDLEVARDFTTDVSTFDQMLMGTYSVPRLDSLKALR